MNRQAAWELLCEYTKNENLRKHALAVEACTRAYARRFGEDEEKWGIVGLIHDFDYEMYRTLLPGRLEASIELNASLKQSLLNSPRISAGLKEAIQNAATDSGSGLRIALPSRAAVRSFAKLVLIKASLS
jgi:predicted hydrolase (HD superfamily)